MLRTGPARFDDLREGPQAAPFREKYIQKPEIGARDGDESVLHLRFPRKTRKASIPRRWFMKRLVGLVVAALFVFSVPVYASNIKIGYVDLQKALNESVAGKAAKAKIAAKFKEYQKSLNARQKKLSAMKSELEKQSMLLSQSARDDKEHEYEQKVKDLQRFAKDAQDDLKQKDSDYTRQIIDKLVGVAKTLGKKEGYTMIFEKTQSSVVYADSKADLTDELIKAFDAQTQKKSGK
jgi:outer membrane protein